MYHGPTLVRDRDASTLPILKNFRNIFTKKIFGDKERYIQQIFGFPLLSKFQKKKLYSTRKNKKIGSVHREPRYRPKKNTNLLVRSVHLCL